MTEIDKRRHRCCFTGHRPEKLSRSAEAVKVRLEEEILKTVSEDLTVFITGMARGVDIWAAEIVLRLKDAGLPLRLICAVPYVGFELRWNPAWREKYSSVLERADFVHYTRPSYSRDCFQIRNQWMVDHSAKVIAVFNGQPSGTKNTIEYAKRVGVPVVLI
jgi:uncharacterized phage-like protein YoqJ